MLTIKLSGTSTYLYSINYIKEKDVARMSKNYGFISRNLSIIAFVVTYLITVSIHISSDSFIAGSQLGLLLIFAPFFIMGAVLDFIVRNNESLNSLLSVLARLLPLGIIIMGMHKNRLINSSENAIVHYYNYYIGFIVWMLIALPLFFASFNRQLFRQKTIRSLTGTAAFGIIYLFLTTKTGALDKGAGFVIILLSYFFIFYAISGIQGLNYAAPVLGIINAISLLIFYRFPGGTDRFAWDSNINIKIDLLILTTFIVCIIIRVYATLMARKSQAQAFWDGQSK